MNIDESVSAVVTGGASGLGEATARALAARGARVAIFDMNVERGQAVAAQIGGLFCKVDVTLEADVDAGFSRARKAYGQERILINCAGIASAEKTVSRNKETGAVFAHSIATFSRTLQINLIGTFTCIAKAAAGMLTLEPLDEQGERGVVISTASVAAEDGQIGQASYAASKAGVMGMTLPIARDLMNEGIRINTILPGILGTPMLAGLPQKVQESLAATVPFPKRLGRPEEYADLALFLISNSYMNAASVRLDGAIRMAPR